MNNGEMATLSGGGGRDRGPDGRARNARPRDALGRPLPYGSPDVARLPEGIRRTPQQTLSDAQRLLDAGRPFHAHEVFEDAWKLATSPPERALWKGLAQLAVGVTHFARGNPRGARILVSRGAAALQRWVEPVPFGPERPAPIEIDVASLLRWSHDFITALDDGSVAPPGMPPLRK
jgi:hypothetical protein